jgi:hypothetical protein
MIRIFTSYKTSTNDRQGQIDHPAIIFQATKTLLTIQQIFNEVIEIFSELVLSGKSYLDVNNLFSGWADLCVGSRISRF